MEPKHLRTILQRHVLDEVAVLLNILCLRHRVAVVELEARLDQILSEPDMGYSVEKPLVKVVCDSSTVLNLTQHEANSLP